MARAGPDRQLILANASTEPKHRHLGNSLDASGSDGQASWLGPRKDIEQHECVLSQLKYKGTGEEDLC